MFAISSFGSLPVNVGSIEDIGSFVELVSIAFHGSLYLYVSIVKHGSLYSHVSIHNPGYFQFGGGI